MLTLNPINQARTIITISQQVGAKLPAPVVEAYTRATQISAAASDLLPGPNELVNAIINALDNSRGPSSDADVQRALVAMQIGDAGIAKQVESVVAEQMRDTFRAHADGIVKAWAKPFDEAAAALHRCHERIGQVQLDDTATILRAGGDIALVWAQAKDATGVTQALADAWTALATMTGFAPVDPRYVALRIAAATREQWDASGLERAKPTAWDAMLADLTLGLADRAEYQRRVAAVQPAPEPERIPREAFTTLSPMTPTAA